MAWSTGFPASAVKSSSVKQRYLQERIKEHDRDIRPYPDLRRFWTRDRHYPIWNEVKFIDRYPHLYTGRVKEAIHVRLDPNNINKVSGIEIPEAWMPTIKKQNNRRTVQQRTAEVTTTRRNNEGSKHQSQPTIVI